jgi:hypothetical protein
MKNKMTRNEAILKLADFYDSIPKEASSFHKMDMILRVLEKRIGMLPPPEHTVDDTTHHGCSWKEEPEDPEHL